MKCVTILKCYNANWVNFNFEALYRKIERKMLSRNVMQYATIL